MRQLWLTTALLLAAPAFADMSMNDDPVTTRLYVQRLEYRDGIGSGNGDDSFIWDDAQIRIGRDLNKVVLRSSGAVEDGTVEEGRIGLLYSRAVLPYWDLQLGWRHDFKPEPQRDWFSIGLAGIAPYEFDSDIFASIGRSGRVELDLEFERELLLTQRWVIAPAIEANWSSKDDPEVGTGSGLTELELGLRVRYRINKNLAPYAGIAWTGLFGDTADFAKLEDQDTRAWQWTIGIKAWY